MYEIKKDKTSGRFIVYRVIEGRHLRQGSFLTEDEACKRINESKKFFLH